jgi:3'-phosphoadenosine 5'-phosphosulfate sulfotransferase (PAPS reductase)/FAD synthetase
MDDQCQQSQDIIDRALRELRPYAVIMMLSGGDDSLTAYHVARALGVHIDAIIHVKTGTGIPDTTQFVRRVGEQAEEQYFEADATGAYEDYVLRKGFFGRGLIAHTYAYHLLKADGFRKLISQHFRQGKRGRDILLLNGARQHESENRMFTMKEPIQRENQTSRNWWVNIINDWTKLQCRAFLNERGIERNPVTRNLCRSGECMCGTMQNAEERREAAFFYPQWGAWLDNLEREVIARHGWGWGIEMPQSLKQERAGQIPFPGFQPMCVGCAEGKG